MWVIDSIVLGAAVALAAAGTQLCTLIKGDTQSAHRRARWPQYGRSGWTTY
jgi:hypothetical protein